MQAITLLFLATLAFVAADCPDPNSAYSITNDAQYTAASSCAVLTLSSISGTTVPLVFDSLTTLKGSVTVQGINSTTLTMKALTSSNGFIITGTPLNYIEIGSTSGAGSNNNGQGLSLSGNNGTYLNVTFRLSTPGNVQVNNNYGLYQFALKSVQIGTFTVNNNAAINIVTLDTTTSLTTFTVTGNPNLATIQFTNGGSLSSGDVSIQGSALTTLSAPFSVLTGSLSLLNNAGSFSWALASTTSFNGGSITITGNSGLTSFAMTPTGNANTFVESNNVNLATFTIGNPNAATTFSPVSVSLDGSNVGVNAQIAVQNTGTISIVGPATTSTFTNLAIGVTQQSGTILTSGTPNINALSITGNTVNALQLINIKAVNTITLGASLAALTVIGQITLQNIQASTTGNPTITGQISSVGNGIAVDTVNNFQALTINGLTSVGFKSSAAIATISIINSNFATGGSGISLAGNYSSNNQFTLNNVGGGVNIAFPGLNSIASDATINGNNFGTLSFPSLQCATTIAITGNTGKSISFPSLAYLTTAIKNGLNSNLNDGVDTTPITVNNVKGKNDACYQCDNPNSNICSTSQSVDFSSACAKTRSCPFVNIIVTSSTMDTTSMATTSTNSPPPVTPTTTGNGNTGTTVVALTISGNPPPTTDQVKQAIIKVLGITDPSLITVSTTAPTKRQTTTTTYYVTIKNGAIAGQSSGAIANTLTSKVNSNPQAFKDNGITVTGAQVISGGIPTTSSVQPVGGSASFLTASVFVAAVAMMAL